MKSKIILSAVLMLALSCAAGLSAQHKITMGDLSQAQQDSIIFAFPQATEGTLYYKDGSVAKSKFNYNFYEPQLLFWNDKPEFPEDTLRRLNDLSNIVVAEIGDRTFVPALSGLGEMILSNRISLISCKKVNISEKKTGAYGTGGSTSSIRNVSSFNSNGTTSSGTYTGQTTSSVVKYEFSSNSEISVAYTLFLLKDGKTYPLTKKNLLKLFPKASGFISQYLEEQKPDLDNPQDMLNLVNLANANEK